MKLFSFYYILFLYTKEEKEIFFLIFSCVYGTIFFVHFGKRVCLFFYWYMNSFFRISLFLCSFFSFCIVSADPGEVSITSNDDGTLQYEYTHVYPVSSGIPFVVWDVRYGDIRVHTEKNGSHIEETYTFPFQVDDRERPTTINMGTHSIPLKKDSSGKYLPIHVQGAFKLYLKKYIYHEKINRKKAEVNYRKFSWGHPLFCTAHDMGFRWEDGKEYWNTQDIHSVSHPLLNFGNSPTSTHRIQKIDTHTQKKYYESGWYETGEITADFNEAKDKFYGLLWEEYIITSEPSRQIWTGVTKRVKKRWRSGRGGRGVKWVNEKVYRTNPNIPIGAGKYIQTPDLEWSVTTYKNKIILFQERNLQYFDIDIAHLEKKCITKKEEYVFQIFKNGAWEKHESDCTPDGADIPTSYPWGTWNPIKNATGTGNPKDGNGWKTDEKGNFYYPLDFSHSLWAVGVGFSPWNFYQTWDTITNLHAHTAWIYSQDDEGESLRFSAPLLGWWEIQKLALYPFAKYTFWKYIKNTPTGRLTYFDTHSSSLSPKNRVWCNENTWYIKKVKGKAKRGRYKNKKKYAPKHTPVAATQEFVLPLENAFRFGVEIRWNTNRGDYHAGKIQKEEIGNFIQTQKIDTKQIRKKAYTLIKNMGNKQISWRVQYIQWQDIILPDIQYTRNAYDILIVKDGNVIIGDNLPRNIGIIVLHDSFHPENDSEKGNIYVTPKVRNMYGFLYADGWLISVKNKNKQLFLSEKERNTLLQKQLVIYGNLFSKNTIGWWKAWILPGNKKTSDSQKTLLYDLDYVRTNTMGCKTKDITTKRCMYEWFLTIVQNPKILELYQKYFH